MCPVWASDCIIRLSWVRFLAVRHHYENVVNYILAARIKVSGTGGSFIGAAGTVGSALEQGISRGHVDLGESLLSGAGNALSEVLYGTGPIKGVKDAFLRGARTGAVMSGLANLTEHVGSYGVAGERIFGKKLDRAVIPTNAGRDPKGMCGAADPFDLFGGLGNGRGYRSGAGHDSGTGGFVRDVLTGAVVGGLGSAGFYGAGKAVDALRGSVVGRGSGEIPASGRRPDFYVTPNGDVIPATGYRYMSSSGASDVLRNGKQYTTYFGFDKFDSAKKAREAFQISYSWSDCKVRGAFDTLQVIDDMYVPTTFGNTTTVPEPFAISYPEYGEGGAQQFRVDKVVEFLEVKIIED